MILTGVINWRTKGKTKMHSKAYKLALNTFLFVVLLLMFVIPISTVGMAGISTNPDVLSASDNRKRIQKPRKQIIMDNAKELDEKDEDEITDYRP